MSLIGRTFVFKNTITLPSGNKIIRKLPDSHILFIIPGTPDSVDAELATTYSRMDLISATQMVYRVRTNAISPVVYDSTYGWNPPPAQDMNYKQITFVSDPDYTLSDSMTESEFIDWLESNADETTSATNYLASDGDLKIVADAIRKKTGISGNLSFPSGYVDAITNIFRDGYSTATASSVTTVSSIPAKGGAYIGTIEGIDHGLYITNAVCVDSSGNYKSLPEGIELTYRHWCYGGKAYFCLTNTTGSAISVNLSIKPHAYLSKMNY